MDCKCWNARRPGRRPRLPHRNGTHFDAVNTEKLVTQSPRSFFSLLGEYVTKQSGSVTRS